jgi:hypothetical protein
LLHYQCFECLVALFLGTSKTHSKCIAVHLLLFDKLAKAGVLFLVLLDLRLEVGCLLGKLCSKSLELLKLRTVSTPLPVTR